MAAKYATLTEAIVTRNQVSGNDNDHVKNEQAFQPEETLSNFNLPVGQASKRR